MIGCDLFFSGVSADMQPRNQRSPAINLTVWVRVHAPVANGVIDVARLETGLHVEGVVGGAA